MNKRLPVSLVLACLLLGLGATTSVIMGAGNQRWSPVRQGADAATSGSACNFFVTDEASLRQAIACVNIATSGAHTITLVADIAYTKPISAINSPAITSLLIAGNGHILDAQNNGRVLALQDLPKATLRDLTLTGGQVGVADAAPDGGGLALNCGSNPVHDPSVCAWTLLNTVVSNNQANSGGGINYRCDYHGDGALIVQDSTIRDNQAASLGGGLFYSSDEESGACSVTLQNTLVQGNHAVDGGGLRIYRPRVTISDSTIRDNVASDTGGGIMARISDGFIDMTVRNSLISGNRAGLSGGGLYIGSPNQTFDIKLINSTVSSNIVTNGAGGGLYLAESAGSLEIALLNSTITKNAAGQGAGVHVFHADSTTAQIGALRLTNSLLAANLGSNCSSETGVGVIFSGPAVTSYGHNLDSDGSCLRPEVRLPTDIASGDAKLGPLADNGGPTFTHALVAGSAAIDAGADDVCAAAPVNGVDQRGVSRPQGPHCDIGAYEAPAPDPGTLPDLVVVAMQVELESGGACNFLSTQLGVRVTVRNNSVAAAAGAFVVDVNGVQQTVSAGLAAGASQTLWFSGYSNGQNSATVDATASVTESDETNNNLTQLLPIPTLPPTCTPTATATPTSTPTPTATATVLPGSDAYENDDTCTQARPIASDGSQYEHTFHRPTDIDYVQLNATANTTYRIEVEVPVEAPTDVELEVYAACEQTPIERWTASFSPNVRLDFTAPASGPLYLRLVNYPDTAFGSQFRYQLSARTLDDSVSNKALIIVAGRLRGGDRLQSNIHNVTGKVYDLYQKNGYTDDNIYYLSTDSGLAGTDATATKANLRAAIIDWAAGRLQANGVLTLYLMDHGNPDLFYIDEFNGQRVTPDELNEWLTQLEGKVNKLKTNLFIEACQAGSFIAPPGSVSKAGRIIVTSTTAQNDAKASLEGAYFSDHFLSQLHQGYNLAASFDQAAQVASQAYRYQQPWLDADGDGVPNEFEDATLAARRSFAYAGTLGGDWAPHIFSVQPPATISNHSGMIRADVRDDVKVRQVWAIVYPPNYQPPSDVQELQAEVLPTFTLTATGEHDSYAGLYPGFTQPGVYRIVVYAIDNEGLSAYPRIITVGSQSYLPLVGR